MNRYALMPDTVTPVRVDDDTAYRMQGRTYAWDRARREAIARAEYEYQRAKARYQQAKAARRQARALPLTEPENEP